MLEIKLDDEDPPEGGSAEAAAGPPDMAPGFSDGALWTLVACGVALFVLPLLHWYTARDPQAGVFPGSGTDDRIGIAIVVIGAFVACAPFTALAIRQDWSLGRWLTARGVRPNQARDELPYVLFDFAAVVAAYVAVRLVHPPRFFRVVDMGNYYDDTSVHPTITTTAWPFFTLVVCAVVAVIAFQVAAREPAGFQVARCWEIWREGARRRRARQGPRG